MLRLFFGLLLTIPALVGAAYAASWSTKQPARPIWPRTLFLILAFIAALMAAEPPHFYYKGAVCLALLILATGDAMTLVPGTPRTVRAGVNGLVYLLLWSAFAITAGRQLWTLPALWGLIPLIAAAALYYFAFFARLGELRVTIGLYTGNAALVLASAAALFAVKPAAWSLLGLAAATLLIAADVILAWDAWQRPLRRATLYWTLCLLFGVAFLAWSVWGDALGNFTGFLHIFG